MDLSPLVCPKPTIHYRGNKPFLFDLLKLTNTILAYPNGTTSGSTQANMTKWFGLPTHKEVYSWARFLSKKHFLLILDFIPTCEKVVLDVARPCFAYHARFGWATS